MAQPLAHLRKGLRRIYVLPAFQDSSVGPPSTKEGRAVLAVDTVVSGTGAGEDWTGEKEILAGLWQQELIEPLDASRQQAHSPTDYPRWFRSSSEYAVTYQSGYEPVLLLPRDELVFDERFTDIGADKASFAYELSRSGHVFVIHPSAFVLHELRESEGKALRSNWTRSLLDWAAFARDVNRRYTPSRWDSPPACEF